VLIRAGRVIEGAPLAAERRLARRRLAGRRLAGRAGAAAPAERELTERERAERERAERELARGPARLCQALGIDRALDGADVCDPASSLRIRPGPLPADASPLPAVSRGPRVGVSSAADRPWRFWLTGDPTVSAYRPYVPRARPKAVSPSAGEGGTMGR
jgi:DNA-3-methyladenine glycosylase